MTLRQFIDFVILVVTCSTGIIMLAQHHKPTVLNLTITGSVIGNGSNTVFEISAP